MKIEKELRSLPFSRMHQVFALFADEVDKNKFGALLEIMIEETIRIFLAVCGLFVLIYGGMIAFMKEVVSPRETLDRLMMAYADHKDGVDIHKDKKDELPISAWSVRKRFFEQHLVVIFVAIATIGAASVSALLLIALLAFNLPILLFIRGRAVLFDLIIFFDRVRFTAGKRATS